MGLVEELKAMGKARRTEVGKREKAAHWTLPPSSPPAEITPSISANAFKRENPSAGGEMDLRSPGAAAVVHFICGAV